MKEYLKALVQSAGSAMQARNLAREYLQALKPGIIDRAVEMRNKLRLIKAQEHPTESLRDYLDKSL